jgi:hypothetical protein
MNSSLDGMNEYRITKYDPSRRNSDGNFLDDDWTSFSDVGKDGSEDGLTIEQYEAFESAYIQTAVDFLVESGGGEMAAVDIHNTAKTKLGFRPGMPLRNGNLMNAMRLVLRELIGARFEDSDGRFVHFGWDYYMYVGVTTECPSAEQAAARRGLFVESFKSPYHRD